ncbi:DUF6907 domain-containing protein [Streptomyces sp. NBC_00648]|uniref:DUF6907 domain-containing protein n=1 Tax=Streptomyces sp. NBC_00648 TaxID=2975797 RepID=UPI00324B8403
MTTTISPTAFRPSGGLLPAMPAQPRPEPATVQPRLVPALVDSHQIHIECPAAWCTLDHIEENPRDIEDIFHFGDDADLEVPRFNAEGEPLLFGYIRPGCDPFGQTPEQRQPFLYLEDGSGEGAYMRAEQAAEFADNLIAFAAQVRAMARTITGGRS